MVSNIISPTVYISVGTPASGKSFWWEHAIEYGTIPENLTMHIQPDFWINEFGTKDSEQLVNKYCMSLLKNSLSLRLPLIYCDGYFITKEIRKPIIEEAKKANYKVVIIWFNIPVEVCKQRNPSKSEQIDLVKKIITLEQPDISEGVDNLWIVKQ